MNSESNLDSSININLVEIQLFETILHQSTHIKLAFSNQVFLRIGFCEKGRNQKRM